MVSVRAACLILAVVWFPPGLGFADPVTPGQMETYEKGFGALQQSTRTFSATIHQTLKLQGLAQPVISDGTLYYAAPDRLLIRFSKPEGEWMLMNGSQYAVQKHGKPLERRDTSVEGKKAAHAASLLDFFRSGPEHWHQSFDVTMTREGDHLQVHLKPWMTPTSTFQGVESIVTTLQLPGYELVAMDIVMNGANSVRYDFSEVRRNLPLDDTLFALPKAGTP